MFETGTKIRILASNAENSASPRKGSVGYVVDSNACYYVNNIEDLSFMMSLHRVIFTRYGPKNKKIRHEIKNIVNLFPIITKKTTTTDSKNHIENTIEKIITGKTKKFDNIERWKKLENNFFPTIKPAAVVIACPEQNAILGLDTCHPLEFKALINSNILSSIVQDMVHAPFPMNQHIVTYPIRFDYIVLLRNMYLIKHKKIDFIKKVLKDISTFTKTLDEKKNKMELIKIINIIKTTEYTRIYTKHLNQFVITSSNNLLWGDLAFFFGKYLFDKHLNMEKTKVVENKKDTDSKAALILLNNIAIVQNILETSNY